MQTKNDYRLQELVITGLEQQLAEKDAKIKRLEADLKEITLFKENITPAEEKCFIELKKIIERSIKNEN